MPEPVERPKILAELFAMVDDFDADIFPPRSASLDTDKQLGEMSPWIRKCYALATHSKREYERIEVEHKYEEDGCEPTGSHARMEELKQRYDTLMEILWYVVRSETNAWGLGQVALRKGWKITAPAQGPREFIRSLLGGLPGFE
jgi:hypothetical protein